MRPIAIAAIALTLTGCGQEEPRLSPATLPNESVADVMNGQALYVQHCLLCHQHDGGGVPNMQPALVGSTLVSGEPEALIDLVLRGIGGQAPALPASGSYNMVMPGVPQLSDQEIADLLTYIRQTFVQTGAVSSETVASVRAKSE